MKTNNYFKESENNIGWVGSNFTRWFGETSFIPAKKVALTYKTLEKPMLDRDILEEWKPEEVDLGVVAWAMAHPEEANLLKNGYCNIFYVRDKQLVLRAVRAIWYGGAWDVEAYPVTDPLSWYADHRVFSRTFGSSNPSLLTLSSSDTLSLESAIKICKEAGLSVIKTY